MADEPENKKVDYSLRIEDRNEVFFETKNPSVKFSLTEILLVSFL